MSALTILKLDSWTPGPSCLELILGVGFQSQCININIIIIILLICSSRMKQRCMSDKCPADGCCFLLGPVAVDFLVRIPPPWLSALLRSQMGIAPYKASHLPYRSTGKGPHNCGTQTFFLLHICMVVCKASASPHHITYNQ